MRSSAKPPIDERNLRVMTDNIKICPDCHAEYFGHVESCAECEVELVTSISNPHDEAMHTENTGSREENVLIEQGGLGVITELTEVLKEAGIEFQAGEMEETLDKVCSDGSCTPEKVYGIVVPASANNAAKEAFDNYWETMDPDMKIANERMLKGHCPACGYDASGATECPECGLNLAGDSSKPAGGCC